MSLNLVIGCGGSGLTTMASLNRLLSQNPDILPQMGDSMYYLAVDTEVAALDDFEKTIKEQMGQYPAPFMQRIQLSQNMNILNEMVGPNFVEPFTGKPDAKGLARIRENWWFNKKGVPFKAPRVSNLIKGAGQCPPASYGLAWYHLGAIGEAIKKIAARMVARGYGDPAQLRNMNLIVIAGLSGGTGRGCWNLIAFKVREYLQAKFKVMVPPVGVFFDANVYENVARDNDGQRLALEVNSLTGLSELSCWMVNGRKTGGDDVFVYNLPNVKTPERTVTDVLKVNLELNPTAGAPVDSAYLICGRSPAAILEDNTQYHEMAGAALYAMIANPDISARQVNDGDPFNSFAAATFEIDTLHIQKWFESRARSIALKGILNSGEDNSIAVTEFFKSAPINVRVRALSDMRQNPDGTIFQRIAAAFLDQKKYKQTLRNIANELSGWKYVDAEEAVSPVLVPSQDVTSVVKGVFEGLGLGAGKLEDLVNEAMRAAYKGNEGQKPSVGRALNFLKELKVELDASLSCLPQSFCMTPEGGSSAVSPREAVLKTLKVFSKRTFKEMLSNVGAYNTDEINKLVKEEAGRWVGIIPEGIIAVNYPKFKAAFEEFVQPAIKRIERLIVACEQFANCCREASVGFVIEEADAAGAKAGTDPFDQIFATPETIETTLYDGDRRQRFYRRTLRPIVASREEAESLAAESINIGEALEKFIGKSLQDGTLEKLAVTSDTSAHSHFVDGLIAATRNGVSLVENFLELNFTFEKVLERNCKYWNEAIVAAMGSGVRMAKLRDKFRRTLGTEPVPNRRNPSAPPTLPPIEKLRTCIAASLASTCAPWWIADTDGAHHSIMMFMPFSLGENIEKVKQDIVQSASHEVNISPYGLDNAKGFVTPFSYLAFVSEGVQLTDVEKEKGLHLLDKVESLKYYQDATVDIWMRKVEDPNGESIFTEENHNKGIGYVSPLYIRNEKLAQSRWRPWLHEDEAEAQIAENKALDALLYGFLGMGLTDAAAKPFEEKFAPYGWHFPILRPGEKQSYFLVRKTYDWNGEKAEFDVACDWKPNKRLCTSACNLYAFLQGKGKTGLSGTAKEKDVEEGNKIRDLILKEADVFAQQIAPDLGANDIGKLKKALKMWLSQMRDGADDADKPVFDALLKRAQAND